MPPKFKPHVVEETERTIGRGLRPYRLFFFDTRPEAVTEEMAVDRLRFELDNPNLAIGYLSREKTAYITNREFEVTGLTPLAVLIAWYYKDVPAIAAAIAGEGTRAGFVHASGY